jgi:hypothetical protein
MTTRSKLAGLVLAVAFAVACGGPGRFIQKGIDAYARGDYPDAAQRFTELEGDQGHMNPKGQVRYLVYRGLTAFHLGKKDEAKALLVKGKAAYDAGDPKWLPPQTVEEMNAVLGGLQ